MPAPPPPKRTSADCPLWSGCASCSPRLECSLGCVRWSERAMHETGKFVRSCSTRSSPASPSTTSPTMSGRITDRHRPIPLPRCSTSQRTRTLPADQPAATASHLTASRSECCPRTPRAAMSDTPKRRHCVQGAVLIAAGAEPEGTGLWSFDDLWRDALGAVVVFVRVAAERRGTSVEDVCRSFLTG